jgi:hypothetical protein
MKKITSWLTLFLVLTVIMPTSAYIAFTPTSVEDEMENTEIIEIVDEPEDEIIQDEFPDSPYFEVVSPPPSYDDESRGSRIKYNASTVISIDSPKNLEFVTLGQSFQVSGGLYEDNNSNGKNDTGDLPIPNAMLHIQWAYSPSWLEVRTDVNGLFTATIPNDDTQQPPEPLPLIIEFWGQWTINGTHYFQIPRNLTDNVPGVDDDHDSADRESDGVDNDGDWDPNTDDLNNNSLPDVNYDGISNYDDDNDGQIDEEIMNGIDDDGDGLIDEDGPGDINGDGDSTYDPEPHIDEPGEGIDEEGVPDGKDNDADTMIDEDCYFEFIPRLNTTKQIWLIIQHKTSISFSASPKNAKIWDQVNLSGQLKDPDTGTAVTNKWIIMKFHDHIINYTKTDGDGKFSFQYQIPSDIEGDKIDVGRRQFTALFDQNYKPDLISYYKSSSKNIYVSVKRNTDIQITNVEKNVYLQGTFTINGKVTDDIGDPPLFNINNDDGSIDTVDTSNYKITFLWGKSAASWAPPPKPGFLGREGNFSITMTLDNPLQPLGKVEVSASFTDLTDKFYLPDQVYDEFLVRGHAKIIEWEDVKGFHRSETAYIRGQLVMQEGSITQGLAEAQLEARWGPNDEFKFLSERTRAEGYFTYIKEIDPSHPLGPIVVYMRFDGENYLQGYIDGFEHSEPFAHKTYYVIAQPKLTMDGGNVIKGDTFELTGKLVDDTGRPMINQYIEIYFSQKPIVNVETGEWEPEDPAVAFIPTDSTGTFKYKYELDDNFPVGKAYGAARFKGFQPPYNASNAFDEAITWNVEFNVSAYTSIVVDQNYVDIDLYRGRDFVLKGKVHEEHKGVINPLKKVKSLHGETLKVDLYMRAAELEDATTHKVGDAIISPLGEFKVIAKVPANIEITDNIELTLVFNGNIRYERSTNVSFHKLWGYVFFDRAEILDSFPDKDDKGRPAVHEVDFNHKSPSYTGPWIISVPIYEDVQGRAPPPVPNATIYLNFSEAYFVNTSVAVTNQNGIATFEFINPLKDKDYPDRIKLLHREKSAWVLEITITFVGSSGLQPTTTSFNMTYYPTPPPEPQEFFEKYGTVISILVVITIILVIFMIVFSSWYIKQQRLRGLKRIIKRAADQLIAGDQYRATIYKSYKKLSAHLRRYGYLRREAETFREFESAIKQALPIDRVSMHRFLDLLEEARYSSHKIGETQRSAAISNLRAIESSLSQIIIDEEAAMRALRKLEEEEKQMAAAETEIIVRPGAEEGGTVPSGPGAPPSLPPGGAGGPKMLPPKPGA